MKSVDVKAVIVEHFPAFECKKVYNEPRQNGGTIIKFYRARYINEAAAEWRRMVDVLKAMGVIAITIHRECKHGGADLILSV